MTCAGVVCTSRIGCGCWPVTARYDARHMMLLLFIFRPPVNLLLTNVSIFMPKGHEYVNINLRNEIKCRESRRNPRLIRGQCGRLAVSETGNPGDQAVDIALQGP